MSKENLYWRLRHAAEVDGSASHASMLNEAATELRRLQDEVAQLKEGRSCMKLNVTINQDQMKKALEQAFIDVIGKDLEYIAQAVYEKMEREGELVGKAQAEAQAEEVAEHTEG